ncbi:MAG: hypothetical protein AB1458_02930 [Bacteroidota bacterium]
MKKIYALPLFLLAFTLTISSCKKEEEKTTAEKMEGQWMTGNQYIQNSQVASADGSYLTFNSNGTGIDHKASDNSTGTFTWSLQNNETQILFSDTTSTGGFWNGTYELVSISETRMVIKTTSILGEYKCELNK